MTALLFAAALVQGAPCDAATAQAATVTDIAQSPDTWIGLCVRVDGVQRGNELLADADARYRREIRWGDPSSTGARIGIDGGSTPAGALSAVTLVGRVARCADPDAAEGAGPPTGFCTVAAGVYLRDATRQGGGEVRAERRLPAMARGDFGNLTPIAARSPWRWRFEGAAREVLKALHDGDRVLVSERLGGEGVPSAQVAAGMHALWDDARSPFAAVRDPRRTVAVEVFGWRPPLWAGADYATAQEQRPQGEAIACYSVHPHIAARWPIDDADADNLAARPYACIRIHYDARPREESWRITVPMAERGAQEPAGS